MRNKLRKTVRAKVSNVNTVFGGRSPLTRARMARKKRENSEKRVSNE